MDDLCSGCWCCRLCILTGHLSITERWCCKEVLVQSWLARKEAGVNHVILLRCFYSKLQLHEQHAALGAVSAITIQKIAAHYLHFAFLSMPQIGYCLWKE